MQLARFTANFTDSYTKEIKAKIRYSSGDGKTILLIDDEEMVINISEMMLKKLGYTVLKAHNGYEGLQLFETKKSKIDLIVNGLLKLSHFRSSDLSHMPFYSEAHSLPPLPLCL